MLIGVVAESDPHETRVAASAETVKKFAGLGAEVAVERGAGSEPESWTRTTRRRARGWPPPARRSAATSS